MASKKTTEEQYEDYLKNLGDALKGVDKSLLYEDFMGKYQSGNFDGLKLCIHRPQWRGDNLRSGKPMKVYQGGFTLMRSIDNMEDGAKVSQAVFECSELAQQLVAKMIVDSMQRTKMENNRIVKVDPVFAYVGDDVRAEPVHPEGIMTIAGVHVDFSFQVFANVSINEDLWQQ